MSNLEEKKIVKDETELLYEKIGHKRKIITIAIVVLVAIACMQLIGFLMYNNQIENYAGMQAETQDKINQIFNNESDSLSKISEELKSIDTDFEGKLSEARTIDNKYKSIIIRNKKTIKDLNQYASKINDLILCSEQIISLTDKSEQLDREYNITPQARKILEISTLESRDEAIGANNNLKKEVANLTLPEEIKKYQNTLVNALDEKQATLSCSNDMIYLSKQVSANYNEAQNASDPYKSLASSLQGMSYFGDIDKIGRELNMHWNNYLKLKSKIK